jgi:SpoIID/LytB domain
VKSVMAMVDEETLSHRPCFLCPDGIGKEQLTFDWSAPEGNDYWIRVNPFPIFDRHFTISVARHERQQIEGHFGDMLALAEQMPEYLIFYNGPMCGASAPDHMHFQAIPRGKLPVERMVDRGDGLRFVTKRDGCVVSRLDKWSCGTFVLGSPDAAALRRQFARLVSLGEIQTEKEWEPRMNILTWCEDGRFTSVVFFRAESRPECFWETNPKKQILISPGAVEMGGVAVVSSMDSFDKISARRLGEIIDEVSYDKNKTDKMEQNFNRKQEILSVGVVSLPELVFDFKKPYSFDGKTYVGEHRATVKDGKVEFEGELYEQVVFHRCSDNASFELRNVTIGVDFHWNRQETQLFPDDLKLIVEKDRVTAINLVGIENYLVSVISSEMSATCSEALLKAHCIISRSWILAQIQKNKDISASDEVYTACIETEEERIKWYDREDHVNFDVCADDHCQRYYGLSRASTAAVRKAVAETWGQVLVYDGKICDARFSKCCGGVFEEFEYCWEPKHYDYLVKRRDSDEGFKLPVGVANEAILPDLTIEENARKWILSSPDAFCNTTDPKILSQVLNNFDQETKNFYRWTVEYTVEELSALVKERSGEDYGEILDLIPIARGTSGRMWKMKIVGTKKTKIIGKELEIRRTLSKSHLYSSAFVVEKKDGKFILRGAGWGHGAGMCQIGAAVMGEKGYSHDQILFHYFPGSKLEQKY